MSLLEFRSVTKSFRSHKVFEDVSFSIDEGKILGLVGQSGSGKTTLIRLILGLYKPDFGDVVFSQKAINIGLASQKYAFYPRLTVLENLWYYVWDE